MVEPASALDGCAVKAMRVRDFGIVGHSGFIEAWLH